MSGFASSTDNRVEVTDNRVEVTDEDSVGTPPKLSVEALAALKEFAVQNGLTTSSTGSKGGSTGSKGGNINARGGGRGGGGGGGGGGKEAPDDDDVMFLISKYFEDPDKNDTFEIDYKSSTDPSKSVSFTVKGVKRELGQTLDSTGLTIWRASEHLCQFIMDNSSLFEGKRVCELGAGLGMVSILLGKLKVASLIVASDGDQDTIDLLDDNIADTESVGAVESAMLYWGELGEFRRRYPFKFEVLMAADVIYEDGQVNPLMDSVVEILNRDNADSKFYLAYARRNVPFDRVLDAAKARGLIGTLLDRGLNNAEPIYSFSFV